MRTESKSSWREIARVVGVDIDTVGAEDVDGPPCGIGMQPEQAKQGEQDGVGGSFRGAQVSLTRWRRLRTRQTRR